MTIRILQNSMSGVPLILGIFIQDVGTFCLCGLSGPLQIFLNRTNLRTPLAAVLSALHCRCDSAPTRTFCNLQTARQSGCMTHFKHSTPQYAGPGCEFIAEPGVYRMSSVSREGFPSPVPEGATQVDGLHSMSFFRVPGHNTECLAPTITTLSDMEAQGVS